MSETKIAKNDKLIMVVPASALFGRNEGLNLEFDGFQEASKVNFKERVLQHGGFMTRGNGKTYFAEADSNYRQPIPYTLVINPEKKKVFGFKRSSNNANYGETRLYGKWSWGVGGHVDFTGDDDIRNPKILEETLARELEEEIVMDGSINNSYILGYLNVNDPVSIVHFGLVYVVETNSENIGPRDSEIEEGRFLSSKELSDICNDSSLEVEGWSRAVVEPLIKLLEK